MRRPLLAAALVASIATSGCAVGPDYVRPTAAAPAAFKEAGNWVPASPADGIDRGAWWSVYADPTLDGLMRQVEISNQNLAQSEAAYRQAQAAASVARSAFFPVLTGAGTSSTQGGPGRARAASAQGIGVARTITVYNANVGASWAPDLWGRIRRSVESARAVAQASAADLASARLSFQADLASNYFAVRAIDEQARLFARNIEGFQRAVDLTTNQYNAGVAARADVVTAEAQLQQVQASQIDLGVQRAALEHAIAILIGQAPSEFALAPAPLALAVPVAPPGVPSALLQRRPDVASAERSVAAANANIGVQTAAWFPTLTLSGTYGVTSVEFGDLFRTSSNVWSFGPQLAQTIFDFGARRGRIAQARAAYDQQVARYRQTVLGALQSVEDQLAALRVLEEEAQVRAAAQASAQRAQELALNRYRAGQVDFTTVVQAQSLTVNAEQSALAVQRQRLLASVALIEALGGGWSEAELPRG